MPIRRAALALLLAVVPACDEHHSDINPSPPRSDVAAAARYELTTHFRDVLPYQGLPDAAIDVLSLLWELRDQPGTTMVGLLVDAGDPLVGEVLDPLPDSLRDQLAGWMDDAIRTAVYHDQRVADRLDALYTMTDAALTGFDLDSTLTVGADPVHRLRAIHFQMDGRDLAVPLPDDLRARARCQATRDEYAQLDLEDHQFGLDYGPALDRALDQALVASYGDDVRGTLGLLVDCDAVAASVAGRCVLGECVEHESELHALCEAGLDAAADELHLRLRSIGIVGLELLDGHGQLADGAPADGVGDELDHGTFNAYLLPPGKSGQMVLDTFTGRATQ